MPYLRQSTSQTIRFGPCLDIGDGVTEETALTLAQADMRLSKDGGAFAQKNAAGNATHDSDGWYSTTLNTTDTATVGELILNVHQPANMLPVWMRWWVLEEAVYDLLFGASADALVTLAGVTHTGAVIPTVTTTTTATTATNLTNLPSIPANWLTAAGINAGAFTAAKFAASSLDGKGDWNIGKTGYSLTQTFPTNFADLAIEVTNGHVTVGALDANVITAASINSNAITAAKINASAFTAAKFAAGSLDGKGDWNIGKTGYSVDTLAANSVNASALATDAVDEIKDAILPVTNTALNNLKFLWVAASDHVTPVTGASTTSVNRSIDGGAFGAGTGTLAEIGNGIYQYDASAADMNGTDICFRFSATGGTPGAPDDAFLIVRTGG